MKKIIISLFFIVSCSLVHSQEALVKIKNTFEVYNNVLNVLPIINQKNDNISLLFIENRRIHNYLIDNDFKIIDSLETDKRNRKFKIVLGNIILNNGDYSVFLTNSNKNKFATIDFSFNDKSTTITELDLNINDDIKEIEKEDNNDDEDDDTINDYRTFVQSLSINNKFYLIFIQNYSAILKIYSFDGTGNFKDSKIDLSQYQFMDRKEETNLINLMFSPDSKLIKTVKLNKFKENSLNSLEETSDFTKLYVDETKNKIIFTFDKNNDYTQLLTIDLNTFKHSYKRIDKYKSNDNFKAKNSNSYIFDKSIYQVSSNREQLVLTIKEIETNKLIKQYKIEKDKPISFANTPIVQNGGMYINHRILKTTKQFLRKTSSSNIGISVNKYGNNYQLSLGCISEIKGNGIMSGMSGIMGGIPIANFGGLTIFFNPTFFAYNLYSNTRSVEFKSILDSNFDHLKGSVKKNAFDLIKTYNDNYHRPEKGRTIFKYKNYYIFGFFNYENHYQLQKFTNE